MEDTRTAAELLLALQEAEARIAALEDQLHGRGGGDGGRMPGGQPGEPAATLRSLRASEWRAQALLRAVPDLMFRLDREGVFLDYKAEREDLHAQDQDTIVGKRNRDISPPGFADLIQRQIALTLDSGEMQTFEYQLPLPGRGVHDYEARMTKSGDDEVIAVVRDITHQRRREEALRESETRFRSYVESSPDGIFVVDENLCTVDVNPAACRMSGHLREELIGKPVVDLVCPEDRQKVRENFASVVTGRRIQAEGRFVRKDGSVGRWVVTALQLSPNRFLGYARDVTEQRQLEEHLRQAEKMRAIGQLAGGVAHDFNNQLFGILGNAQLLKVALRDRPELAERADEIITIAGHSRDLTTSMLAFSRKGKFVQRLVDVNQLVLEVISLLQHSIEKNIAVRHGLTKEPTTSLGDPSQLQNAILNLALNARDAMPQGGEIQFVTELVDHLPVDDLGDSERRTTRYVKLSVIDAGVGMDEETMARAFEPFFTTKPDGGGVGMGLAAVYGTIKNHGGEVRIESSVGRGSRLDVYLPWNAAECGDRPSEAPSSAAGLAAATVLVVDDERMVRDVSVALLRSLGHDAIACADGGEAVERYRAQWRQIDLVLLDLVMPGIDAEETFAALREINADVRVIVTSGYAIDGRAQRIIDRGAFGFIQKPYRIEALEALLREVLSARAS